MNDTKVLLLQCHHIELILFLYSFSGIKHGSIKVVKEILGKDATCALIRNEYGHTPLHIAVDEGNLAAVILLCRRSPTSARIQVGLVCIELF